MTIKEFIKFTGYKEQTVYAYIHKGRIEASKENNRFSITQEEADKWKKKKELWDDLKNI